MVERAGERQDLLDARAVAENVNRELADGAQVPEHVDQLGGRRQPVPGGGRRRYVIPRATTVTTVPGKELQPSKRRKKVDTADAFPESEYPENYTREQINMMERNKKKLLPKRKLTMVFFMLWQARNQAPLRTRPRTPEQTTQPLSLPPVSASMAPPPETSPARKPDWKSWKGSHQGKKSLRVPRTLRRPSWRRQLRQKL